MKIEANSVEAYLNSIPEERKESFNKLRATILKNIPKGFEETLSYGMIGYVVPKDIYPDGYHCNPKLPLPFANIANQKNFIAFYHMGLYADKTLYDWFVKSYSNYCKSKPDMGKSCVRFKKTDDIPYELIGQLMQKMSPESWIELYEKNYKK